ncbi:MAG: hypothetical protein KC588_04655 [Nitrospira sp.]|nr:hypothetical protein [Nitrospira sp.]
MKQTVKRIGPGIQLTQMQRPLWMCLVGAVASLWLMGFSGFGERHSLKSSLYSVSNIPSLHPDDTENSHKGFAPSIQTLVVTPDGVVYAGSFGMGLFRSQDKGNSWEALNRGLTDPFLLCLAVMPGKHIYAGTMRGGIYRLGLKGTTWESIGTGLHEAEVKSFLVHQDVVYAGTGTGVYRWVEAEKQWVTVGAGLDRILVPGLAIMDDGKLLAATSGKGLFHLETQHPPPSTWVDSQSIFIDPQERLPHRYLRVIAVNEAQQIFLGTQDGGIFTSTDRGQSWTSLSRNLPNDSIRSIVPDHKDVIVATGNGIFRWKTDQHKWMGMNTGLTNLAIQSLTISDTGELYAGTSSGAFRSQDGGAHWTNISQGLGVQFVPKGPYE